MFIIPDGNCPRLMTQPFTYPYIKMLTAFNRSAAPWKESKVDQIGMTVSGVSEFAISLRTTSSASIRSSRNLSRRGNNWILGNKSERVMIPPVSFWSVRFSLTKPRALRLITKMYDCRTTSTYLPHIVGNWDSNAWGSSSLWFAFRSIPSIPASLFMVYNGGLQTHLKLSPESK